MMNAPASACLEGIYWVEGFDQIRLPLLFQTTGAPT